MLKVILENKDHKVNKDLKVIQVLEVHKALKALKDLREIQVIYLLKQVFGQIISLSLLVFGQFKYTFLV